MNELMNKNELGEVWKGTNGDEKAMLKKVAIKIISKNKIQDENKNAMRHTLNNNANLLNLDH